MTTLGIIGSGNIGTAVARLAVDAGIDIVISNSRGPESLAPLVAELGEHARAGTAEAAAASEFVLFSIPLNMHTKIEPKLLGGKVVLDTSNYYPSRDGRIAELDSEELTTSELVQRHFADARLVKAFNNILAHHIPLLARPSGAEDRTALPVAGDDDEAKALAAVLMDQLGFDTVDAGSSAESWRVEPETSAYTTLYLADPNTPMEEIMQAPAAPVSADELRAALQNVNRVSVIDRQF